MQIPVYAVGDLVYNKKGDIVMIMNLIADTKLNKYLYEGSDGMMYTDDDLED